jgi:hypothetical protein
MYATRSANHDSLLTHFTEFFQNRTTSRHRPLVASTSLILTPEQKLGRYPYLTWIHHINTPTPIPADLGESVHISSISQLPLPFLRQTLFFLRGCMNRVSPSNDLLNHKAVLSTDNTQHVPSKTKIEARWQTIFRNRVYRR